MIDTLALVLILGAASYRLTRLLVRDSITDRFRQAIARWAFDQTQERWRSPFRQRVSYFTTCPFCVGVWVSAGVWVWWDVVPGGRPVLLVAALAGVQAFLSSRPGA